MEDFFCYLDWPLFFDNGSNSLTLLLQSAFFNSLLLFVGFFSVTVKIMYRINRGWLN